jgi:perosamine synthetase
MSLRIPLSAPDITQAEIDAVTAVLRNPQICFGPELTAFESALARYHSVENAVAVSSGTAGLHLALIALGVGEGDEVIVPSFAFIAVANTVHQVGAVPVFAEIDPVTLNLNPSAVEDAITSRTRAILVVHTFGVPADMEAFEAIALRHHLALIEDACEAIGAEFDSRRVGGFGDMAVFGFYPNKQITTGEGGAILCRNASQAARLRSLRNQGRAGGEWLDQVEAGFNYRLSDLACALGRVQLSRIDEILLLREQAAARYHSLLSGIPGLELPPIVLPRRKLSWFVFVIRLPEGVNRESLQAAMAGDGIATGRYFAPLHQQPALKAVSGRPSNQLALTEQIAPRMMALPFFNRITEREQEEVSASLRRAIAIAREL